VLIVGPTAALMVVLTAALMVGPTAAPTGPQTADARY
jgi:hypothetical protein